jgi:hypothetical protein
MIALDSLHSAALRVSALPLLNSALRVRVRVRVTLRLAVYRLRCALKYYESNKRNSGVMSFLGGTMDRCTLFE